jgi:hypothetical protein
MLPTLVKIKELSPEKANKIIEYSTTLSLSNTEGVHKRINLRCDVDDAHSLLGGSDATFF